MISPTDIILQNDMSILLNPLLVATLASQSDIALHDNDEDDPLGSLVAAACGSRRSSIIVMESKGLFHTHRHNMGSRVALLGPHGSPDVSSDSQGQKR
jgi:hypothetical protein